ncbi:MAG: GGDEF domain-containing protein [Desulfovibrio sp.]|nr:GGDEF domain-containing protein [Desulfovibrio sp.]
MTSLPPPQDEESTVTRNKDISLIILQALDSAVLCRTARRRYAFFGKIPQFYIELFPSGGVEPCTEPWRESPMLEFFLDDAERFFEEGEEGSVSSGVWQEDGRVEGTTALVAIAVSFEGVQAIIVRKLYDDYVEKTRILRKAREQLLQSRAMEQNLEIFRTQARIDGLTKIYNRSAFTDLLGGEIRRSMALDYPLSILFLDIDDFKKINDTFGHLAGDAVLQNLGGILTKTLRRNDIIARYGGEEFVVLLPHEPPERAYMIGEKVRKRIAAMSFPDVPPVTVSVGCTTYLPQESVEKFIRRADSALYDAKRTGKNIVRVR